MNVKELFKDTQKIAKISIFIIFLALVRSICEPFRLQYLSPTTLTFEDVKLFLMAALIASISLLFMTLLFYYARYKAIILISGLTIMTLLILKTIYI